MKAKNTVIAQNKKADTGEKRRAEMLALCVALGHAELADEVMKTDCPADFMDRLSALAKEYVRDGGRI